MIDAKDKKLLVELDMDARASNAQLARRVGLSKQGVEYKLQRLSEKGVISGYYPVIDMCKLGYIYGRILITLQNLTKQEDMALRKELIADEQFFWIFSVQGQFDIVLITWSKSVTDLYNTVQELQFKYGKNIAKVATSIGTDIVQLQHRYFTRQHETKEIHITQAKEHARLDDVDKNILQVLCDDARMSLVNIGQKVDLHPKVVAYRMNKMERSGVIVAYRASINHEVLGNSWVKVWCTLRNQTPSIVRAIQEQVKRNPITIDLVEALNNPGELDFEVMVEQSHEIHYLMQELKHKYPTIIGDYQTLALISVDKVRYWPF